MVSQRCGSSGFLKGNKTAIGPNGEDLTDVKNTRGRKMAREIDIMNFCGLARTLITICNIASMGKNFRLQKNRFINKPLEPGQFLSGEETLEKVLQFYVSGGQTSVRWAIS